ncbi:hypothetical protein GJ631_00210 [Natronomonas sp. CBA1123]|jgi:hypothetical protein|uniref:hypothetical protein n=1 Tax=Natronomonas sp. CBA1123 TaxID=2668070 RepID=UPI0012EA5C4B|nr:hypothetical protein [Natronomonas sp. CBA1123]MUV85045.1 hypothetical protein [Natronomonas sp. CBA1123]
MNNPLEDNEVPGWALGMLLLATTVAVAGVTDYVLTNAGYRNLGLFVWAVCYTGVLLIVWVLWLSDIELTGPAEG